MKIAVCFLSTVKNHFNLLKLKEYIKESNHQIDIYEYINNESKIYINLGETIYFNYEYLRKKLNHNYYYTYSPHRLYKNIGVEFLPIVDMYYNHKNEYDFYLFWEDDMVTFGTNNIFNKIDFNCDVIFENKRNIGNESIWYKDFKCVFNDKNIKIIYQGLNQIYGGNNNFFSNFLEFIKDNNAHNEIIIGTFALNYNYKVHYIDKYIKFYLSNLKIENEIKKGDYYDLIHPIKSIEEYEKIKKIIFEN